MLKQGWMLKSQDFSKFSELWISELTWCCLLANYTALICFRLTVTLCWAMRRHTRIKNELDKIGIKKQGVEQSMLTFSSLMLKPNRIRTFDSMTWTPEHIHLTKWKTPASSKLATVRPGLWTCQISYRPSRRSLPGCVRESRRERSKGKNGGIKNYYSPTDRQGYQWS